MREPLEIGDAEVEAFERDGVVCLRGVLPQAWLERMAAPLERELCGARSADLTEMARGLAQGGGASPEPAGRFRAGTDHWRHDADFRAFACASPLPAIAARLMRSATVRLYEDSLLVKEPGTAEVTAFHQDMGYFHFDGERACTFWCPLDPVDASSGAVRYVRGSHLSGTLYRPNLFVTRREIPGAEGAPLPDVEGRPAEHDLVSFELAPGDVAVHHARTLHGAPGNRSARRRRAISVRYVGDAARYRPRPGSPVKPACAHLAEGDALDESFPLVWDGGPVHG